MQGIENVTLFIPPDHPSATELFNLIGLQAVVINKLNAEAARVNAGGDRGAFDRLDQDMRLINEKIKALLS